MRWVKRIGSGIALCLFGAFMWWCATVGAPLLARHARHVVAVDLSDETEQCIVRIEKGVLTLVSVKSECPRDVACHFSGQYVFDPALGDVWRKDPVFGFQNIGTDCLTKAAYSDEIPPYFRAAIRAEIEY